MSTSYHDLHTPISRPAMAKYIGTTVAAKEARDCGSSDIPYSSDIVDAISYYFENSQDMSAYEEPAGEISWEISSTWKLLMDIHGIEMVHEACMSDSEMNSVHHAFSTMPSFRRLVAVLKWLNWVNSFEEVPHLEPSSAAYPLSGKGVPIDGSAQLDGKDLQRERTLCRAVWLLLTQGKVAEAIDLCVSCGHDWRAGVLQAAVGTDDDDYYLVDYDKSRFKVKEIAREICSVRNTSSDPFDVAITGFLCGNERAMRNVSHQKWSHSLWAQLYCLKEEFMANLVLDQTGEDLEKKLCVEMDAILKAHEAMNDFQSIQMLLIQNDFNAVIDICLNWVATETVRMNLTDWEVSSIVSILLREFSANLATVYRDIICVPDLNDENISAIYQNQIESLIGQYKTQLRDGNEIIIETISLVKNFDQQVNLWTWYLKQYSVGPPIDSLIEVFPSGVIPVLSMLMTDYIEKHLPLIISRTVGASVVEGAQISFALETVNDCWLLVQATAKSTGAGIYMDIADEDDPESAAEKTMLTFADLVAQGIMVLMLADLNSAKSFVDKINQVKKNNIVSIYEAIEEEPNHLLVPLFSFIHILDRVGAIMERTSLLEQQEQNLAKLNNKTGRSVGTETRRQILDTQRSITATKDMIGKLVEEITHTLTEFLKEEKCPLAFENSPLLEPVIPVIVDVLIESSVQAIALVDDRKRQNSLVSAVRESTWIPDVINIRRLSEILEDISD